MYSPTPDEIESPTEDSENDFQDSISPVVRASLLGLFSSSNMHVARSLQPLCTVSANGALDSDKIPREEQICILTQTGTDSLPTCGWFLIGGRNSGGVVVWGGQAGVGFLPQLFPHL